MGFLKEAKKICNNIQLLTGVQCTLLEMQDGQVNVSAFHCGCMPGNKSCSAKETHNIGSREAARWGGQNQYQCSCGTSFLSTILYQSDTGEEYSLIAGPFRVTEAKNFFLGEISVPCLQTEQVQALKETMQSLCGYLNCGHFLTVSEAKEQMESLYQMDLSEESMEHPSYPIEEERCLQQLIRAGERAQAGKLLNSLLLELYRRDGGDLIQLRRRICELITLMSRAVLDSGAETEQVLRLCDSRKQQIGQLQSFDDLDRCLAETLHQFFNVVFDFGGKKHQTTIRDISSYIQGHLSEKITLDDVASHVHLSKSYLCRILKEEIGSTFTEYTNHLRVERSKTYLHQRELTLAEIAYRSGFDDQSYFTRIFKKYVGMPPGQYRITSLGA